MRMGKASASHYQHQSSSFEGTISIQPNVSPFPVQPCPVCGVDTKYCVWKQYTRSLYHGLASKKLGKLENMAMGGSPVTPLVCTQCGYVQHFVNPNDFRDEPE